ncbi:beta-glucosidase I [Penicillium taxi]|uniref:beta-glucosidase I n=1 Tax=Penicillium taxi TaxID=168475 RepID=UPI0025455475|nr:beta-glucosidase I [Penicillium taxi]KAJ5893918.1 beta-glucosidase I [Penicillium taxi]
MDSWVLAACSLMVRWWWTTLRTRSRALPSSAVEQAKTAEQAVIFAGLISEWETEGYDLDHMDLPRAVTNSSHSDTPVTMPLVKDARAVVQACFGGDECSNSIADVLCGDVNPPQNC